LFFRVDGIRKVILTAKFNLKLLNSIEFDKQSKNNKTKLFPLKDILKIYISKKSKIITSHKLLFV
jgi:hypothetical protein